MKFLMPSANEAIRGRLLHVDEEGLWDLDAEL
jgi:hypothetical protein